MKYIEGKAAGPEGPADVVSGSGRPPALAAAQVIQHPKVAGLAAMFHAVGFRINIVLVHRDDSSALVTADGLHLAVDFTPETGVKLGATLKQQALEVWLASRISKISRPKTCAYAYALGFENPENPGP